MNWVRITITSILLTSALQQPGRNAIEGQVVYSKGGTQLPIPNSRILLTAPDAQFTGPQGPEYNELASTITDEMGRFRLVGFGAGRYRLTASAPGFVTGQYGQRSPNRPGIPITLPEGGLSAPVIFSLSPTSTVTGFVRDFDNEPMAGVDVRLSKIGYLPDGQRTLILANVATTDDRGFYRLYWVTPDEYVISAVLPVTFAGGRIEPRNPNLSPVRAGYAPTYYPGVSDLARAQTLKLKPGETFDGVVMQLRPVSSRNLSGKVTGTAGAVRALLFLVPSAGSAVASPMQTQSDETGKYEFRNVPPGRYNLQAIKIPEEPAEISVRVVEIQDNDVVGFNVSVEKRASLRGRIVTDDGSALPNLSRTSVNLGLAGGSTLPFGSGGRIGADGTFEVTNMSQGMFTAGLSNLPAGYFIKSAKFGRAEAWITPFTFTGERDDILEITVSSAAGSINGVVTGPNSAPFSPASVVLLPEASLRTRSGYVKTATVDQNGSFSMRGIPPGDYTLFAWDYLEGNAFYNPEFIRLYEAKGLSVSIEANKPIELRIPVIERTD